MRLLLSAAALIGIIWCMIPVFTAAVFNLGTATGLAVFGIILLYGLYPEQFMAMFQKLPAFVRIAVSTAAVIILALTVLISVLMVKACAQKPQEDCTVVVLGCEVIGDRPSLMLTERLEAARIFLEAHPASCAVLSGGMGSTEEISEAEAMYRWLSARGIDPSRLYKEDRSESTRQNLQYSLEVIRENGLNEHIAAATNEFHVLRAQMIAHKLGIACDGLPAKTAWWLFAVNYIRELYGVLYEYTF